MHAKRNNTNDVRYTIKTMKKLFAIANEYDKLPTDNLSDQIYTFSSYFMSAYFLGTMSEEKMESIKNDFCLKIIWMTGATDTSKIKSILNDYIKNLYPSGAGGGGVCEHTIQRTCNEIRKHLKLNTYTLSDTIQDNFESLLCVIEDSLYGNPALAEPYDFIFISDAFYDIYLEYDLSLRAYPSRYYLKINNIIQRIITIHFKASSKTVDEMAVIREKVLHEMTIFREAKTNKERKSILEMIADL